MEQPLLGAVNLYDWIGKPHELRAPPMLDWVIVGGESWRGARPMHPAWARSLRDQCASADVPFLFKQ
jgi:protein gp37